MKMKSIITSICLVVTAAIVGVLYSPIGSPELYQNNNSVIITATNAKSSEINQLPQFKSKTTTKADEEGLNVSVENNSLNEIKEGFKVKSNQFSGGAVNQSSYAANQPKSQDVQTGSTAAASGMMILAMSKNNSSGSTGKASATSFGLQSKNSPLQSPFGTNSNELSDPGATDPGGDPTGPPIKAPIHDGLLTLLMLSLAYIVFRIKIKR